MSIIQHIPVTSPEGTIFATGGKYCPHDLRAVPRLCELTVTVNGTYAVPEGYAGWGTIKVAVGADESTPCTHQGMVTTILTEPTCTREGSARHTCPACGYTETVTLPTADHDDESTVTDPTCEFDGYTTYTCRDCGRVLVGSYVARLGHAWGEVHEDSRFSSGYAVTCSRCGESEEADAP